MAYRVDGLSMLLSSDWFDPAWQICGLSSPNPIRQQIRIGCREIVSNLLGQEERYWDVEFSEARQRLTEQRFVDCLQRCQAEHRDIQILNQLISGEPGCIESKFDQTLVSTLLALLVSEYPKDTKIRDGISLNIYSVVSSSVEAFNGLPEIKSLAASADSDWDIWLKKMTGEVPRFLINVAQDIYDACDGFSRSWAIINNKLHEDERELLVGWLNKWGMLLADKVAVPPK